MPHLSRRFSYHTISMWNYSPLCCPDNQISMLWCTRSPLVSGKDTRFIITANSQQKTAQYTFQSEKEVRGGRFWSSWWSTSAWIHNSRRFIHLNFFQLYKNEAKIFRKHDLPCYWAGDIIWSHGLHRNNWAEFDLHTQPACTCQL